MITMSSTSLLDVPHSYQYLDDFINQECFVSAWITNMKYNPLFEYVDCLEKTIRLTTSG